MDFLRWSFLHREGTGELFPDRCSGDRNVPHLFQARTRNAHRRNMKRRGSSETQISVRWDCDNAELHAELRDVPLPAGFMQRVRQIVDCGIDEAEALGDG